MQVYWLFLVRAINLSKVVPFSLQGPMGLEGLQGPPGSQVLLVNFTKSLHVTFSSKDPLALLNMAIGSEGATAYNTNCPLPFDGYNLSCSLLLSSPTELSNPVLTNPVLCHGPTSLLCYQALGRPACLYCIPSLGAHTPSNRQVGYLMPYCLLEHCICSRVRQNPCIPWKANQDPCAILPWSRPKTSPSYAIRHSTQL